MRRIVFAVLIAVPLALAQAGPASAQLHLSILDLWYAALYDVNRVTIAGLLAEEASMRLDDRGIVQTKAEYLASLDEWEDIVASADFAWQLDATLPADANGATALVCYQFPDNEVLIRERFSFSSGKIVESVQATVSDSCDSF